MLDEDILIPLMFFLTVIVVSIGWPLARALARRIDRRSIGLSVPTEVAQRLERMEQSLDAMAVEIERISEGQRFTTRLLADRSADAQPAQPVLPGSRSDR